MKTLKLKISGMHCSSCGKVIAMNLSDLPGASDIEIDAKAGKGSLNIDESLLKSEQVLKAVEEAGYKAEIID